MRLACSTLASVLMLLVGNGLTVRGQGVAPPPGGATDPVVPRTPERVRPREQAPETPEPGTPARARPVDRGDGSQPPATPQPSDADEFLKDYDSDRDGALTREELPPSLRERFGRIDANRDGKITRRELEQNLMHMYPQRRPSDFIFALLEMSAADPHNQEEVQRIYGVLRKVDKNHDGKIDEDELQGCRQQILKDRIDFLFAELDTDKDGKISRTEARGQLRQDFDRLDTNRDGFIDRKELLHAATAHGPARQAPGATGAVDPANPHTAVPPPGSQTPPARTNIRPYDPDANVPPAPPATGRPIRRPPVDDNATPPPATTPSGRVLPERAPRPDVTPIPPQ